MCIPSLNPVFKPLLAPQNSRYQRRFLAVAIVSASFDLLGVASWAWSYRIKLDRTREADAIFDSSLAYRSILSESVYLRQARKDDLGIL
jgi:hypothetical protein